MSLIVNGFVPLSHILETQNKLDGGINEKLGKLALKVVEGASRSLKKDGSLVNLDILVRSLIGVIVISILCPSAPFYVYLVAGAITGLACHILSPKNRID